MDVKTYRETPPEIISDRLISWNEVYPTYQSFKDAIIAAAKSDPICLQIRLQSLNRLMEIQS